MSRLGQLFKDRTKRAVLMPYTTAGFPSLEGCRQVMAAFLTGGADMIELGVPFSDPLADGPIVQASTQQALDQGVTPDDVLELAREFSGRTPIVLLVYYNCIFAYGQEKFVAAAADAGVDGLIVPDLPLDEAGEYIDACRAHGVDPILLIAPTTPDARIAMIVAQASGFIYCVSVAGVTGARISLSAQLPDFLQRIKDQTAVPLAVGFGISTPEHAAVVARHADGVIIGSRLIKMVNDAPDIDMACREVVEFLQAVNEVLA